MLVPDELESGKNQLPCRDHESLRSPEYGVWVDNIIDLINERSPDRTRPRIVLRKLWEKEMLPSCQMLYLCTYISAGRLIQQLESDTKEYFSYRQSSVDRVQEAKNSVRHLKDSLLQEQTHAAKLFHFPELNHDLLSITQLINDCLNAVEEMKRVHVKNDSLGRGDRNIPVMSKFYAHLSLNCVHPGNTSTPISEIAVLLPVLYEAIIGEKPKRDYLADSLTKEAKRYLDVKCMRKQGEMLEYVEEILPGFSDSTSSINEMREDMRPRSDQISHDADAMRALAKEYKILLKDHKPVGL